MEDLQEQAIAIIYGDGSDDEFEEQLENEERPPWDDGGEVSAEQKMEQLVELLFLNGVPPSDVRTFDECGMCTYSRGVVVNIRGFGEFQLTIIKRS